MGAEVHCQITELRNEFDGRLGGLAMALHKTADDLEGVREGELTTLAGDLITLEQKVAKWIHAHPLPAKISEARLYALEARLSQETDARLHLEYSFKGIRAHGGTMTPRSNDSQNFALPQLMGHKS